MQGNENPKSQNERKWMPKSHPARIWHQMAIFPLNFAIFPFPKFATCRARNGAQKAKMKANESPKGQNERKWKPQKPKWKEMKPKRPKWKEMKAQKPPSQDLVPNGNFPSKFCIFFFSKICHLQSQKWRPKNQNEKKWRPKRPKWKEMKAQKARMKGNESPKG